MKSNLICMVIIWSFGSFAFFLVPYYLSSIKGADIYALSLATEFAEFVASIICIFITRLVKLNRGLMFFCLLIAAASVAMTVFRFFVIK